MSNQTWVRRVFFGATLSLAVACTPIMRNHGYIPVAEDLANVIVGQDTRETVIAAVGPPTSGSVLEGGDLYYVSSKFRHFGALAPVETNREVLAISFNAQGTVANIERFGLEDGKIVALSRRVTETSITNNTFLRQLFGSFGRIDAGSVLGE